MSGRNSFHCVDDIGISIFKIWLKFHSSFFFPVGPTDSASAWVYMMVRTQPKPLPLIFTHAMCALGWHLTSKEISVWYAESPAFYDHSCCQYNVVRRLTIEYTYYPVKHHLMIWMKYPYQGKYAGPIYTWPKSRHPYVCWYIAPTNGAKPSATASMTSMLAIFLPNLSDYYAFGGNSAPFKMAAEISRNHGTILKIYTT